MMRQATAILALLVATQGAAQDQFALPQGCDAYATIQKRSCIVTHLFTCEGDPENHQRRVDLTEEGMAYIGRIDFETQWVESFSPASGSTNLLGPDVTDPASLTELIENGRDTFDFETTSNIFGTTRYVGSDWLTGNDIELNGITLLGTEFEVVAYGEDDSESWRVEGQEFIVPEWRTFVSGLRRVTSSGDVRDSNNSPVEIAFPGEPGFLASKPVYDCSVVLSRLEGL